MKKLFLIPLMTLMTCVMAWADPVTTLADLQTALNAGGEVTLGANINAGATAVTFSSGTATLDLGEYTLSSTISASGDAAKGGLVISGGSLTVKGSGSITAAAGNAILVKGGALIVKSGTISAGNEGIFATAGSITVEGGTIHGTADNAIFTRGQALTISGGAFTGGWGAIQADNNVVLTISGGSFTGGDQEIALNAWSSIANANPTATISGGTFNGNGILPYDAASLTVTGGSYATNPVDYLNLESYIVLKPSTMYVVSALSGDVVAYNLSKCTTHTSLSDAIEGASNGNEIYLYKNDATAISVSKNITIFTNDHSTNLTAGTGYGKAVVGNKIIFTDSELVAFLISEGTSSLTLEADANISTKGAIHVKGNKTLTINSGVTVTYKRQGSLANIVVDEGAKLTILGSGTFQPVIGTDIEISATAADHVGNRIIDVDGELVVGAKNDASNQPHFITTSIARGSAVTVNEGGSAVFNNANMDVAHVSIWNNGNVTIHGGEYVSCSTYQNGVNGNWFAYHLKNAQGGYMEIHGGHFVGVQGAFTCETSATADIRGGVFETRNGKNFVTGEPNPQDNHYALYVTEYGVVNIYDGYFKVQTPSAGGGEVALIGDNDSKTTFGVINLYGGNFARKPKLTHKKAQDDPMTFPASIPSTSQWYSSFGLEVPLPAGYEYYEITEGEDYEAGYRYGVQRIPGKEADAIDPAQQAAQEADPEYTIPWQQSTTWATDVVPEENTIVTIPVGATVTVSKDEATKEAVADQVYVNQGATLVVEEGTVLNVGDGGVNVANGGQIVVEPGAIVTVGSAGLVTTEEEALVVESSETTQGAFLIAPAVTENTQPKATVKLTSKARQAGADEFVFERFAIPTIDGSQTKYNAENLDTITIYNGGSFAQGLYKWDGSSWADVASFKQLEPFKGYQLTNTSKYGNVIYTFEGNLVGNADQDFSFAASGFGFFGNSYTGDIDIANFLGSFDSNMQKTIWVYDPYTDSFKSVTESSYGSVYYGTRANRHGLITDIRSMQAFLMNTFAEGASSTGVDYSSAIWGNPKYGLVSSPAPARFEDVNEDRVTVYVATETMEDEVTFIRRDEYSSEFDNGADASKWMNSNAMNLYVVTANGNLSNVATDNIEDITISFQSGNDTEYILGFDNLRGEEYSIRDIMTGVVTRMTEGATYNFTQEPNTLIEARFQIVESRKVPTGVDNNATAPVMQKVMKNGTIYILRDADKFTIDGQSVK